MGKFQKVILIDDDEITNFINENLIYETGMTDRVETFVNAEEVLQSIEQVGGGTDKPILILLDLKMPVFDGFDFLEKFNALDLSRFPHIKIIVLTSSENPRDIERLRTLNSHEYITKPLTKEKLEAI